MSRERVVLWVIAAALVVPTFLLATSDVHTDGNDCGTALVTHDPTRVMVQTGDITTDDYRAQTVRDACGHLITRQRAGVAVALAALVACLVAAPRVDDRRTIPGDPVL